MSNVDMTWRFKGESSNVVSTQEHFLMYEYTAGLTDGVKIAECRVTYNDSVVTCEVTLCEYDLQSPVSNV